MSDEGKVYAVVSADNWVGIYVNNLLVRECKSIGIVEAISIVTAIGPARDLLSIEVDQQWFDAIGYLPLHLQDVRRATYEDSLLANLRRDTCGEPPVFDRDAGC